MSTWRPLALAVWLGASGACLAAEPQLAGPPPALAPAASESLGHLSLPAAAGAGRRLSLDVALQAVGLDGSAVDAVSERVEARSHQLPSPVGERRMHLDLHLGRTSSAGRSPGDAPPLYGEVGIDVDPLAGLSLVPSYRLVLDEGDSPDSRAIEAQVLKLGARIRF